MKIGTQDFTGGYVGTEEVKKIALGEDIVWEQSGPTPPVPTGYTSQYLTFDIKTGGTINWAYYGSSSSIQPATIEYSVNNGAWTSITASNPAETISVSAGDKVRFRGSNDWYGHTNENSTFQGSTAGFEVYGNSMSLIYGDNFSGQTALPAYISDDGFSTFTNLFRNCTGLTSAEHLILPATTLYPYCYAYMFYSCTSLTTAPVLPATTLETNCYTYMFYGCENLTTAPALPAPTAQTSCYAYMFCYCTSLTSAPALPATNCRASCYKNMFQGCISLTTAPEVLPATTLVNSNYCYQYMFSGCTSLVTAPELPATAIIATTYCYNGMFAGCTSLTTAPEISAISPGTANSKNFTNMFSGCTNLNYIKCLIASPPTAATQNNNPLYNWVSGVQNVSGVFVKNPSASWPRNNTRGVPTNWTILDNPTHTTGVWLKKYEGTEISGTPENNSYRWSFDWYEDGIDQFCIIENGNYLNLDAHICGYEHGCDDSIKGGEGGWDDDNQEWIECADKTGVRIITSYPLMEVTYTPGATPALYVETYNEDCTCEEQGLCDDGSGNCVECDPCAADGNMGYGSYEECRCAEFGENCEEPEEEPEE